MIFIYLFFNLDESAFLCHFVPPFFLFFYACIQQSLVPRYWFEGFFFFSLFLRFKSKMKAVFLIGSLSWSTSELE